MRNDLPWTALKRRCMKRKLHVTWRHRQAVAVDDFGLSNQIVTCGMVCPCAFATVTE